MQYEISGEIMEIEETEDAIYYVSSGGKPVDKGIVRFIDKINTFTFVRTRLSCQGHFVKYLTDAPLYYGDDGDFKGKSSWFGKVSTSRIKSPFVIIEFFDKEMRSEFIKHFIRRRMNFLDRDINLHIITPKMVRYADYFKPRSFIISKFNDFYVSVSMFLGKLRYFRYQSDKIQCNVYVKYWRNFMFRKVIKTLTEIDEEWEIEDGN